MLSTRSDTFFRHQEQLCGGGWSTTGIGKQYSDVTWIDQKWSTYGVFDIGYFCLFMVIYGNSLLIYG